MPRDIRIKCRLAAQLGTAITAVSEASRTMVCSLGQVSPQLVEVIPNGVDLTRFRPCLPGAYQRQTFREKLGLSAEAPVVVHVAGLRPIKDQATLFRAWQLVTASWPRASLPGPCLLLAGEGPCGADLMALARQLQITDSVRFLGHRRDLDTLLPACDLFVLSSLSEGMSFAILEAMAAGLPVVATRVGGNGELVEDGQTGLLVPARDPVTLAEALGQFLRNKEGRQRMANRARQSIEQRFDQARSAARYLDLYHRLAMRTDKPNLARTAM
jgi:glycosyltransferase involved in cell wall biosynthesis